MLGPRQTGKSTLLKTRFPQALYIDLLADEVFRQLSSAPESLRHAVGDHKLVVLDEIQKLPGLLDEVQRLIDTRETRFLLTGSSARKLRRGRANLLGGRAIFFQLHPLTSIEIGLDGIDRLLERGGLPGIVDSPIHWEALKAYAGAYLREEIQAEALTRSIENFSRFLARKFHQFHRARPCARPFGRLRRASLAPAKVIGHVTLRAVHLCSCKDVIGHPCARPFGRLRRASLLLQRCANLGQEIRPEAAKRAHMQTVVSATGQYLHAVQ